MKLFIGQLLPLATAKQVATRSPKIIATTIGGQSMAVDLGRCYPKESTARVDLDKCRAVTDNFCLVCIPDIGQPFIVPDPDPVPVKPKGHVLNVPMSSDGIVHKARATYVTQHGITTVFPKSQRAGKAHESAMHKAKSFASDSRVTGKESLSRGGIYSPTGKDVVVYTKTGKKKIMPENIALQPKHSRKSSPSKYDQRTENRNFNKIAAIAWDDAGAPLNIKKKRDEFRMVIEAANAVLETIK